MFGRKKQEPETATAGWRPVFADPPPDGYRWTPMNDSYLPLICQTCFASVSNSAAELHAVWHQQAATGGGGE